MFKRTLFILSIITSLACDAQQSAQEHLNQPMYLLDTVLYKHTVTLPKNTWYTLRGKYPIWDKIEFFDNGGNYPAKAYIEMHTIEERQYGDGTRDTICCGTMKTYGQTYLGNLIMTLTDASGEQMPVRWDDSRLQQHVRKVYANYRSQVTYYTIEKINR